MAAASGSTTEQIVAKLWTLTPFVLLARDLSGVCRAPADGPLGGATADAPCPRACSVRFGRWQIRVAKK